MVLVYIAQKRANRNGFPPKGMCVFVCVGVGVCALAHAHRIEKERVRAYVHERVDTSVWGNNQKIRQFTQESLMAVSLASKDREYCFSKTEIKDKRGSSKMVQEKCTPVWVIER